MLLASKLGADESLPWCLVHRERMGLPRRDRFGRNEPTRKLAGRANHASPPGIINPNAVDGEISPGSGKIPGVDVEAAGFRALRLVVLANTAAPLPVFLLAENRSKAVAAFELGSG